MEFLLIFFGVILLIIGLLLSHKQKQAEKKASSSKDEAFLAALRQGTAPTKEQSKDEAFLASLKQEALGKKPIQNKDEAFLASLKQEAIAKKAETAAPEPPPAPKAEPVLKQTENVDTSVYKKGSLGAFISDISKGAHESGIKIELSATNDTLSLTDPQLISLTSLMLKRAVTACEKSGKKTIEFSARKSAADVVLNCIFPDIRDKAITESRVILKFTAEKAKGVFVFSDNGLTSSEQAIIPNSSITF